MYQNGNLISYHLKFYYWGFLAEDIYYELTYDFSMPKKTGVDPYSILTGGFSFIADFAPFDVENFGLSIGNININALLSVSWIKVSTDIPGGGGDGTINYTYPIYTPTTSITLLTGEGTGGYNCSKVENSYY